MAILPANSLRYLICDINECHNLTSDPNYPNAKMGGYARVNIHSPKKSEVS